MSEPDTPRSPPGRNSADIVNLRKRGRTACTRCKNRKQKCDEQLPVCSNCLRAGVDCDKANIASQPLPIAYTRALEDRVAQLEMVLAENARHPRHPPPRHVGDAQSPETETETSVRRPSASPAVRNSHSPYDTPWRSDALAEVVGFISLGNFEAPAYVGPSAGLSLAVNLGEMVQATVWKKAIPEVVDTPAGLGLGASPSTATPAPRGGVRAMTKEEMVRYSIKEPPSDALTAPLLHLYITQLHPRYPFLQPAELWKLQREHATTDIATASHLAPAQRYGIFKLYMVYAIGATLHQLTDKSLKVAPERFYMTALQHMAAAREPRTVQNIEAMTLLVIYHLRSASGLGMWYMIGLAMRTCIDLGMHRKSYEQGMSTATIHARRRLFWTVYALERTIAISLGRPFSIPDRQIDVDLPHATLAAYGPSEESETGDDIRIAILLFQLRRIESRIHHSVYRADKPLSTLRPKLDSLFAALEAWRASLAGSTGSANDGDGAGNSLAYLLLHYHRAVRMLIQPFLTILPVTDPYFEHCLTAAGNICQSHKRLHQSMHYGHSFIAVQTVFVAGATLLYGLWTQTHRVWSVTLADDLRACSLVLFVMGERSAWVRKYRDAFELLVGATMEKLRRRSGEGEGEGEATEATLADLATVAQTHARDRDMNYNYTRVNQADGQGHSQSGLPAQAARVQPQEQPLHQDAPESDPTGSGRSPPATAADAVPSFAFISNEGGRGEDGDVLYLVKELANWIDQDQDTTTVWMPDFETLQNLPSFAPP